MSLASDWLASGMQRAIVTQGIIAGQCAQCGDTGVSGVGFTGMRRLGIGEWACWCPAGERVWQAHEAKLAGTEARAALAGAMVPAKYAEMDLDSFGLLGAVKKSAEKTRALREVREWVANLTPGPSPLRRGEAQRPWLLLQGRTGRGKTGLAVGVLKVLAAAGRVCRFVATFDMLDDLKARFGGDTQGYTDALATVDVLVIDELVPPRITEWNRGVLFELVYRRDARQLVTILTTAAGDDEVITAIGEAGYRRVKENSRKVVVEGNEIHYGK